MQIESGRLSRHCKLDLKIGYLACYPNGSLQFENYAGDSDAFETDEALFVSRPIMSKAHGNYAASPDRYGGSRYGRFFDEKSRSTAPDQRSQSTIATSANSRQQLARSIQRYSVRTPFTNAGKEESVYGG